MPAEGKDKGGDARGTPASAIAGALLALCGSLVLLWLFYLAYGGGDSPTTQRAEFALGLAGAVLLSAVAQLAVLVGVWLLWRAVRRPRDE
jgi:hypothetical protein